MDLGTLYTIYKDNATNFRVFCGFLLTTFVLGGYVQTILLNTLIFGYLSYKSMEFLNTTYADADKTKTVYTGLFKQWVVFSTLIVLEYFLGFLVGVIYTTMKLIGFVYLLQDNPNLFLVYDYGLLPFFSRYDIYIGQLFSYLESKANTFRSIEPDKQRVNYNVLYWLSDKVPFLGRFITKPKQKKLE